MESSAGPHSSTRRTRSHREDGQRDQQGQDVGVAGQHQVVAGQHDEGEDADEDEVKDFAGAVRILGDVGHVQGLRSMSLAIWGANAALDGSFSASGSVR
jgi:hypothetical protein